MSTTTPSERAGKLTAEERERYGELIWDCYRRYDGFSCGWDQLKDYRSESVDNLMDAAEAVIAAFLEDHPRDETGEWGAAITLKSPDDEITMRYSAVVNAAVISIVAGPSVATCMEHDYPAACHSQTVVLTSVDDVKGVGRTLFAIAAKMQSAAAPMPARGGTEGADG